MAKSNKTTPKPAAPAYRGLVTQQKLDAFLTLARESGISQDACTLEGFPAFVESLNATAGVAPVWTALNKTGIDMCELCQRDKKASVATQQVEIDTGSRSVVMFMNVCDPCRPKALAMTP